MQAQENQQVDQRSAILIDHAHLPGTPIILSLSETSRRAMRPEASTANPMTATTQFLALAYAQQIMLV